MVMGSILATVSRAIVFRYGLPARNGLAGRTFMYTILKALILPPVGLLILALLGVVAPRKRAWPRRGALACLALVLIGSLPAVSGRLIHALEVYPPLAPGTIAGSGAGAIVILGAEMVRGHGGARSEPGPMTLARLRQGAALSRASGLPLLVSGGLVGGSRESLGAVMRQSLEADFQVPVAWTEETSRTTLENAAASAAMLRNAGIGTIVVVTHAWHLPRAVREFERHGMRVIPAPVLATIPPPLIRGSSWIPSVKALEDVHYAAHEAIGILYYRLHHAIGADQSSENASHSTPTSFGVVAKAWTEPPSSTRQVSRPEA